MICPKCGSWMTAFQPDLFEPECGLANGCIMGACPVCGWPVEDEWDEDEKLGRFNKIQEILIEIIREQDNI